MKIGGYFGLTAPMFLMYYDEFPEESFKYSLGVLDSSINSELLKSFKLELAYLLKTLNSIQPEYVPAGSLTPFTDLEGEKRISLRDGKLVGVSGEDSYYALCDEITNLALIRIFKSLEKNDGKFDLSFIDFNSYENTLRNFNNLLKGFLNRSELRVIPKRLASSFLATMEANSTTYDLPDTRKFLCSAFSFTEKLPEQFRYSDELIRLTDSEYKLLTFYYSQRDTIVQLLNSISVNQREEEVVFDVPFSTLVGRKPKSLFYLVARKFDYAKNKNGLFLRNVIGSTQNETKRLRKMFSDKVSERAIDDTLLTRGTVLEIINSFLSEKQRFFQSLLADSYLDAGYLIQSDMDLLSDLYDISVKMTINGINQKFGCDFSEDSFLQTIDKFNKLGICGLNLFSLHLFKESVKCISLLPSDKIIKSKDEIQQFDAVMQDIDSLIATLIPIGVKINV